MTLDQEDIVAIASEVVQQLRQLFTHAPTQVSKRPQQALQGEHKRSEESPKGATSKSAAPLLLTSKEAAVKLATTAKTLETWRCRGKGPKFVKLGRSVRYRMSDLQEYMQALPAP